MTPTKYVLLVDNGAICLRGYAKETLKGYFNVESCKIVTGKSFDGMRKHGAKLAKRFGVPFEDKTA